MAMIASSIFESLLDTIEPHRLWLYKAIALWPIRQKNETSETHGVMHAFFSRPLNVVFSFQMLPSTFVAKDIFLVVITEGIGAEIKWTHWGLNPAPPAC